MPHTEHTLNASQPRVLTFETYAAQRGASMSDMGDAALHKAHTRQSRKQRQRQLDAQHQADNVWSTRREQARCDYEAMLTRGEIRQPTRRERLERTAQGHPDNPSVLAARRILARMNAVAGATTCPKSNT